jgi:hypothetical protein
MKGDLKVYKYQNQDTNIKAVRIFINKISGCINSFLLRKEPTEQELSQNSFKVDKSIIEVVDRLNEDLIVLVIKAEDNAVFSITLQTVHQKSDILSAITISEDLNFNLRLSPNKY